MINSLQSSIITQTGVVSVTTSSSTSITIDNSGCSSVDVILVTNGDSSSEASLSVYGYAFGDVSYDYMDAIMEGTTIDTSDAKVHTLNINPVKDYTHIVLENEDNATITVNGIVIKRKQVSPSLAEISNGFNAVI
jgi:hypothetical protein